MTESGKKVDGDELLRKQRRSFFVDFPFLIVSGIYSFTGTVDW